MPEFCTMKYSCNSICNKRFKCNSQCHSLRHMLFTVLLMFLKWWGQYWFLFGLKQLCTNTERKNYTCFHFKLCLTLGWKYNSLSQLADEGSLLKLFVVTGQSCKNFILSSCRAVQCCYIFRFRLWKWGFKRCVYHLTWIQLAKKWTLAAGRPHTHNCVT